jgi:arylsulfatase A-like enzyme
MEVYAGYSENADWNVGRLLDAVEEMGDLDNTLIFYTWGDNGASMEGTVTGSFNEMTFLNGIVLGADLTVRSFTTLAARRPSGRSSPPPDLSRGHAGLGPEPVVTREWRAGWEFGRNWWCENGEPLC